MVSRRSLIKAGVLGGLVLSAGGAWYVATRDVARSGLPQSTRAMFRAVAPVILAGALTNDDAIERLLDHVERALAGLSVGAQTELSDLFGLLDLYPSRKLLTGVSDWSLSGADEIAAFLHNWRFHRFALLQSGYAALHDIVIGAWYAQPESWEAIGYLGPPEVR